MKQDQKQSLRPGATVGSTHCIPTAPDSPKELPKFTFEVTAGGIQVIEIGQDAALCWGAVRAVHAMFHHPTQTAETQKKWVEPSGTK